MKRLKVSATSTIGAASAKVYAVLADYRVHHPRIVPREYFRELEVESGGVGAGTRTRLVMRVLGTTKEARHVISEPEPGRVLVESDVDGTTTTTFTVEPADEGRATRLTIATELDTRGGPLGAVERFLASRVLRRIYRKEMALIDAYVRQLSP